MNRITNPTKYGLSVILLTVLLTSFFVSYANASGTKPNVNNEFNKFSLQQNVTGIVKDSLGNNMPGVTVQLKGTNQGTATDINGRYNLSAPANSTLVFSMIGYTRQEIVIDGKAIIDVILNEDAS